MEITADDVPVVSIQASEDPASSNGESASASIPQDPSKPGMKLSENEGSIIETRPVLIPDFVSLDAPSHLYMRLWPSVGPSVRIFVGPYVPCYFRRWKERILGASCAVYLALLDTTTHLHKRSCPSVCPSVRPSVCLMLFSNDEKRHVPCSNEDEISYGLSRIDWRFWRKCRRTSIL